MSLKNTKYSFSSVTKFLHWAIFLMVVNQLVTINWRKALENTDPNSLTLILLHKSIGLLIMAAAILMLIWRHVGTRPSLDMLKPWERLLAKVVHMGLYIGLFLMPITGYMMSSYSGYGVKFFGYAVPIFVQKNPEMAEWYNQAHSMIIGFMLALIVLHIVGALKHHFIDKNTILKRML